MTKALPVMPPCPPPREYRDTFFSGPKETAWSIKARQDYRMFIKGFNYAMGKPNIPSPGEYL